MVREYPTYLPRPHWGAERFPADPIENYRYQAEPQDFRGPPMGIDKALREQCKIPAKYYFVAAILDDGTEVTFSSPNRSHEGLVPKFFNMQRWVQWTTHPGSTATSPLSEEPDLGAEDYTRQNITEYGGRRSFDRRRNHPSDSFEAQRNRKRARAVGFHRDLDLMDDDPAPVVKAKKISIKIGESQQVWDLYDQRFKNMQQTACKIMAKAWVKLVEPKKQSTHPYTGSDEKAPDWWPRPWGPTRDEKVRHKEPDHLYKKERVYLLNHILRMIVEPNTKQHPDIQKLNLNVEKLQAATDEALSSFFLDKDNPNNGRKKPYLKELFHVARFEERYKNGEIDGDTDVWVMADDKVPESYQSDNEDSTPSREEEEQEVAQVPSTMSPQRAGGATSLMPAPPNDHDHGSNLQNPSFLTDLPHRSNPYPQSMLPANLNTDHQSYIESGSMNVNGSGAIHATPVSMALQEICPNPHESNRRGSMFNASADFGTPTTPAIYQAWQQSTTAPANAPMYSFTPQQQAQGAGSFVPQTTVAPYMGQPFDGMGRAGYDTSQEGLFRNTSVSSGPVHPHGYPMPLPHDHRGLQGQKAEVHGRGLH